MTEAVENRVAGFLGLCMRAGQLTSGQEACVDAIRRGNAKIVFLDEGASDNTKKRVQDACDAHEVALYTLSEGTLGWCIGKSGRMVITLPEGNMATKLLTQLDGEPRL
ncbi:MAG: hypothetical protein GX096_08405 [Clostridiales bacterium]|nr:hypothetical protein [Clostridiales bacterium]